jgi:uncharacterized repeat protein (TIGR01451 family)/fimbrial isopeptide formation D2 family protein
MNPRANTFRAFPVLLAFTLNLLAGPMLPVAQQTLIRAAADGIDDYAQCQIGNPRPAGLDCAEKWTNGILNATHNQYAEDEVVPQRLLMDFGGAGNHSVTISYMTRKDSGGQHHAYDSLATWNHTYVNADRCQTPTATDCIGGAESTFPIPSDPNAVSPGGPQPTSAHELPQANRQFVMYGGTITGTSAITHSVDSTEAGSDYGNITVSFTVGAGGKVQLLFGGHLASGLGARGWGAGLGSASISGGPYHIRVTAIDGSSIGNRDNQIMSNAITPLEPSLVISKTADAASVSTGSNIGFTITVTNNGPGVASGATLSDPLPFGDGVDWAISPAYAGPGTCSITGSPPAETLNCAFGDLADDASASVHVQSGTTSASCKAYPNTATAQATNFGQVSASATTTVSCPVLSIEKTTSTPVVTAGGVALYTITVSNSGAAGTGTATGVTISDALPAGLTWTENPDKAECVISGGNSLSCTNITLAPGASFSVTVQGTTDAGDCPSILNRATFTSANDGSGASHPEGQGVQISVLCPDARVSKTGNGPISAGQTATFTIVVTAGGTGDSTGVMLNDDLPAGLTWALGSADDEAACSINTAVDPDHLTCNFGTMANGSTRTVKLSGVTDAGECPQISNTAIVSATVDVNPSNNSSTATIAVQCPVLSIEKTTSTPVVTAGGVALYTITVSNSGAAGTGTATGVTISDALPAGLTWTENPDKAECVISGGNSLSCTNITLAPGASFSVTVQGTTDAGDCPSILNRATFTSANDGSGASHPEGQGVQISVLCPDARVSKTGNGPISAGQTATFTIVVTAGGTGDSTGVMLNDDLPAGLTWALGSADDEAACSINTAVDPDHLTCNFGTMANGSTRTVKLSGVTDAGECPQISNTAIVSATVDVNPSNNSSTATIAVQCPGMNVTKVADKSPIDAGETASYTMVVWNSGPGTALGATFHDELPDDVNWSIQLLNGDADDVCSVSSSVVPGGPEHWSADCQFGSLPVTSMANGKQIRISGVTDRADCGTLDNDAFADADNDDRVGPAEASITVKCPTISVVKVNNQPSPVLPGTVVSYTVTVTVTDGPAKSVVVTDVLPAGLDAPTSISNGGSYTAATRTITWSLGELANGSHALTYQAAVSAGTAQGALTNLATATSPNSQCPDAENLADECDDDSTVTVRVPTLVIDKSASTEVVHFVFDADGDVLSVTPTTVTWTLSYTLTNGPVTNAVITDPLPEFLNFVSASNGGTFAAGVITWNLGTLSSSGSVSFVTTVDPDAPETGPIVNVATIDSNETAPDQGQDSIRVTSESELAGTPTPRPSLPNTALVFGPNGEPVSIPVELMVVLFLGSLGTLAVANVRASRRRR